MLTPRHAARLSALVTSCAVAFSAIAQSTAPPGQTYPAKPIRIITTEAGSGNDIAVRIMAPGLTAALGQQMIVDNRGIGSAELAAKAPPDGYTLLSYGTSLWLTPLLRNNVTYDPIRDYAPITLTARAPGIIVVPVSLPAKSIPELIALARSKPGELNYGSATTGSLPHLAGELFKSMAGVNIVRKPYKGSAQALNALIGEQVQMMFSNVGVVTSQLKAGRLRALAVSTAQPSALAPGLPTVSSAGLPGYEVSSPFAMFAPGKTPAPLIARLNHEMVRILNSPDVKDKLFSTGVEIVANTPQELAAVIQAEIAKWGKVIREVGIRE